MKPGVIHATFGENLEYTSKRWGWPGAVFYGIGVVAVIVMVTTGVMTIAGSL